MEPTQLEQCKIRGNTYLISWISLNIYFPKFHLSTSVFFKLRADWKEDCETLADWDIWYYIDWDFTE